MAIKLNKEISLKTVTEVVAVLVQLYDKMHWLNSLSLIILALKNTQEEKSWSYLSKNKYEFPRVGYTLSPKFRHITQIPRPLISQKTLIHYFEHLFMFYSKLSNSLNSTNLTAKRYLLCNIKTVNQ